MLKIITVTKYFGFSNIPNQNYCSTKGCEIVLLDMQCSS